jgi:hypothetical protein
LNWYDPDTRPIPAMAFGIDAFNALTRVFTVV